MPYIVPEVNVILLLHCVWKKLIVNLIIERIANKKIPL